MTTISMFIAVYGNQVLFKVSAVPLKQVLIRGKFLALQGVLFATNIQKSILHLLASANVIECEDRERGSLDNTGTVSSK